MPTFDISQENTMPLFNQAIAKILSPAEMVGIGNTLDIYVQDGAPSSMALKLVEGAQQRLRFDTLFTQVKELRQDYEFNPHLYELVAATFSKEEMIDLCQRLGLDSKGLRLDAAGLFGWGYDAFNQRKQAETAQKEAGTETFLEKIGEVKPNLDLSAFGEVAVSPSREAASQQESQKRSPKQTLPPPPPKNQYENFDLTISKVSDNYLIEAKYSRGGEDKVFNEKINLVEDIKFAKLYETISKLSGNLKTAKEIGRLMREQLLPPEIWALFMRTSGNAKDRHSSGLRFRLRIEPPEIGMLPWEYCFDENYNFLALDRDFPLIRYINLPFIPDTVNAPRPAIVLLVSAGPSDMDTLDVAAEAAFIHHELKALIDEGELVIRQIDHATLDSLHSNLVDFRPHILHFIGHGTFDLEEDEGALALENEDGTAHLVSPDQLAALLKGIDLKIVILNACKTAAHTSSGAFMGIAPALVKADIPAVIAMRFSMPDKTAARFARNIYHFLAMGLPLDSAITEARINIFAYDATFWAIPVLFMRSEDGVIWQEREL
jgi:hypothetical protein